MSKSDRLLSRPIIKQEKQEILKKVLNEEKVDLGGLRELAVSRYGLVDDEIRKQAWPLLLGMGTASDLPFYGSKQFEEHPYFEQVGLDVNRCAGRFPHSMNPKIQKNLQCQLKKLIMELLCHNPDLHYYQGFHDVCLTFLMVLSHSDALKVVDALMKNHLRDFMDVDMNRTRKMLNYLYPILGRADPDLHDFLLKSEVGTIFCLSWLITWYGHALEDKSTIERLHDLFLATHPLMPVYLATAIVIHRRDQVFQTECEMCFVHVLLSHLPEELPYEELIEEALQLFLHFHPEDLADESEFEYQSSTTMKNYEHFMKIFGLTTIPDIPVRPLKKLPNSSGETRVGYRVYWWAAAIVGTAAIVAFNYISLTNTS